MHKPPTSIFLLLVIPILNSNLSAASILWVNNVITEEKIRSFIKSEQLPKDLNHSFLYDILTKESLSYLEPDTMGKISSFINRDIDTITENTTMDIKNRGIEGIKILLKCLFDRGFNPYLCNCAIL